MKNSIYFGARIGNLTVIQKLGDKRASISYYECQCDCGNKVKRQYKNLRYNLHDSMQSCGCLNPMVLNKMPEELLMKNHPSYRSWTAMKNRCDNPSDPKFKNYGGRGVTYDPKWQTFSGFLEDMGEKPARGWHLDKDKKGGVGCLLYCKENCCWLPPRENVILTSRTIPESEKMDWNRMREQGMSYRAIAKIVGRSYSAVRSHLCKV